MKEIRNIKSRLGICTVAVIAITGNTYSEIWIYDGFSLDGSYDHEQTLNGLSGGKGFDGPWEVDTSASVLNVNRYVGQSGAPVYTDAKGNVLQSKEGDLGLRATGTGNAPLMRAFKKELTGTFWISFLTRMDEQVGYGWDIQFLDATDEMQLKFMNGRAENNRWRIQSMKTETGQNKDGLFKSKPGLTPTDFTLVLLKIVNAGSGEADGQVIAYLNPADLRDPEISARASLKISGLLLNPIKKFRFDKKTTAKGCFDELRIGTDMEDVLPQL